MQDTPEPTSVLVKPLPKWKSPIRVPGLGIVPRPTGTKTFSIRVSSYLVTNGFACYADEEIPDTKNPLLPQEGSESGSDEDSATEALELEGENPDSQTQEGEHSGDPSGEEDNPKKKRRKP
jgi:hypothetical protein